MEKGRGEKEQKKKTQIEAGFPISSAEQNLGVLSS